MIHLQSIEDFLRRDSAKLANTVLDCPLCGRMHKTPFGKMEVGRDLVEQIPSIAWKMFGYIPQRTSLIYDRAIEPLIRQRVSGPLVSGGMRLTMLGLGEPGSLLDSDRETANSALAQADKDSELVIGAGSGVISDITKWVATKIGAPFILLGTAPSMNSYTSDTASMTENDVKISVKLSPAEAILMDIELLSTAPIEMIHAGMGDLAARAICNADWKLSQLLRKTFFCPLPFQMTAENERQYLADATETRVKKPQAIHRLAEAVLISGLSMTVVDETAPSSGAEHILSHFWDFLMHVRGLPRNLHGTQVGIGTIISLNLYDYMRKLDPGRINPQAVLRSRPSIEEIEAENEKLYGHKAAIFNQVMRTKRIPDQEFIPYVRSILDSWDQIWEALDPYITPVETIRAPLLKAGMTLTLEAIHRTRQEGLEALLKGSQYRNRYTMLDLAWELGIFPDAAEEILELSQVV